MSARRTITRRLTTTVAAVALATGAVTAAPSAGAETTDLPSSVSDVTEGSTQAALGSLVLVGITVGTAYCLITSSFTPDGGDSCPS